MSLSGRRIRHTPRGAHVPSTNRSTPMRRNLATGGVGTARPRARGNLGGYAEEDVTEQSHKSLGRWLGDSFGNSAVKRKRHVCELPT